MCGDHRAQERKASIRKHSHDIINMKAEAIPGYFGLDAAEQIGNKGKQYTD